jgi:retron-type reverse transcriptase
LVQLQGWPRAAAAGTADGGKRPFGLPTLEDKIVQGAVAEVLSTPFRLRSYP